MNARAEIAARYDATPYAARALEERAADDLLLWLMAERVKGRSTRQLAEATGLTHAWIRTATNRVKIADAECGERIAGHYWTGHTGPQHRRAA